MLAQGNNISLHFFQGSLPDDVPVISPDAIRTMTVDFDVDRLEVMVIEPGDEQGFLLTALVFLNKGRDEGYYFCGLVDAEGYHFQFPRAMDVVDTLRTIVDETRVELGVFASGEGLRLACEPDNFFQQLKNDQVGWRKNDEPKLADTSCIPMGSNCDGCPYARAIPGKPDQQDGYCAYLDLGDWMTKLGFSLLWDGLKECKVNLD